MAKRRRRRRIQRDMAMNDRPKRNHAGAAFAALAVSFVLLAVLVNTAFGRYQHQLDSDGWIRAREFYFTSDFLDGSTYTLAQDSTEVSFSVGNHADELRFSEVDIDYTVTVDNGATVTVVASGTLAKNDKSDGTVTISDLKPGETYTVTATGKEPGTTDTGVGYTKTLSATIRVLEQAARVYYHLDNQSEYTLLTVWNEGNIDKNVTIKYEGIPDNTNPNMGDWTTDGSQSVEIRAHESKVFRFFNVTGTIDVKDATKKTPK